MRILFITANRIGDAVLTTGLLSHLVRSFPNARLTVAVGPAAADLFRAVPGIERLLVLKKEKRSGHWIRLWRQCVGTRWDIIVDLRNSLVTRFLRAGQKHYRLAHNSGRHKVEDHAAALGLLPPPAPQIWTDKKAEEQAATLCGNEENILALGPSANWPPKQWPPERYAALARGLTEENGAMRGAKIMLIAAPHERKQLAPLYAAFPPDRLIDLVGQDLLTVAACLKRARLFVGNDSGATHIAAAVGVKTLALFGPGWEKIYGPWGPHATVLRPSFGAQELLDRLPYVGADAPNLMEDISVIKALKAAEDRLGR